MAGSAKSKNSKRRLLRISLVLFTFLLIIASAVLLLWLTARGLFSRNQHFTIKRIVVKSPGWWNGREAEIILALNTREQDWPGKKVGEVLRILRPNYREKEPTANYIKLGKTNLFGIRPKKIREKLEEIPSIDKAEVFRIIPDTLEVRIVERIPRAFLGNRKSRWVVDASGVVMDRNSCIDIDQSLPVIVGYEDEYSGKITAGMELSCLKPALDLIMKVVTEYPKFEIRFVKLGQDLQMNMNYRKINGKHKYYLVIIPRKNIDQKLFELKKTILNAEYRNDPRGVINLRYDNMGVLE